MPKNTAALLARGQVELAARFPAPAGRFDRPSLGDLEAGELDGDSGSEGDTADDPPASRRQRVARRRAVPAARLALAQGGEAADAKPRTAHDYCGGRLNE